MRAGRKAGERASRAGSRGGHRFALRASVAGALVTVPLLATAVPAYADTSVSVSDRVLNIEAGRASDNLTISVETGGRLTVRNTTDTLSAADGCRNVDANTVRCTAPVTGIAVSTRGGDDIVRNETALTTAAVLGPGDDTYTGSSARDVVIGGTGDDALDGRGGPDVLVGAEGADSADGGAGGDLCLAEVVTACEI